MSTVRILAINTVVLVLGALALAATATAGRTAVGCNAEAGVRIAVTPSYRFALHVGMPEKMYTPAQARKMHPQQGEVMVRGSMSMGGIMMGGSMRHLEVQICSKSTNAVVTNANPTIVVVDATAHGMPTNVPIAVMEGIGKGVADLHYGNNVTMPAGHRFTITVKLNGQRAVLHVTSPKTM